MAWDEDLLTADKGGSWDVGSWYKPWAWGCWQGKVCQSALVIQMDQESLEVNKKETH